MEMCIKEKEFENTALETENEALEQIRCNCNVK